jgi:hypothetical protein
MEFIQKYCFMGLPKILLMHQILGHYSISTRSIVLQGVRGNANSIGLTLPMFVNIIIIISPLQSTAGHGPLQFFASRPARRSRLAFFSRQI